jgi:hypothetical protein
VLKNPPGSARINRTMNRTRAGRPTGQTEAQPDASRPGTLLLSVWSIAAAFGTYFCVYAFRQPWKAGTFSDQFVGGIGYKTILLAAQTLGYTLSKFIGIKVIAEMKPERRALTILLLIGLALLALLPFGLVPPPWNLVFLFLNGLPLGVIFGLVLSFLEGRRVTEALTAGLCASFVVADGFYKSLGRGLLDRGVSEYWMPFFVGLLFVVPLVVFVELLRRIPPPAAEDVAQRSERTPMTRADRWHLFRKYAVGLTLLIVVYLLLTVLRSLQSDFGVEIWSGLDEKYSKGEPDVYATSQLIIGLGVALVSGTVIALRDNRRAFFTSLGLCLAGFGLVALAVLGWSARGLGPYRFMVLCGLGLYIPYVVIQTTVFERLLALLRERGNLGYLVYLADAWGYLGYVAVMVARNFVVRGSAAQDFLDLFLTASWLIALVSIGLLGLAWWYFARRTRTATAANSAAG